MIELIFIFLSCNFKSFYISLYICKSIVTWFSCIEISPMKWRIQKILLMGLISPGSGPAPWIGSLDLCLGCALSFAYFSKIIFIQKRKYSILKISHIIGSKYYNYRNILKITSFFIGVLLVTWFVRIHDFNLCVRFGDMWMAGVTCVLTS